MRKPDDSSDLLRTALRCLQKNMVTLSNPFGSSSYYWMTSVAGDLKFLEWRLCLLRISDACRTVFQVLLSFWQLNTYQKMVFTSSVSQPKPTSTSVTLTQWKTCT